MEKLYGLDIKKVNTARFMGRVEMRIDRKYKKTEAWKKVFIHTKGLNIAPFLNKPV